MVAALSLVVVVTIGLIITRIATVAFTMTGMSLDSARFQARSAFTGTGFTTSESEAVVSHPARRRIVMMLMLVSHAGAVSVLGTTVLSFARVDSRAHGLERAAVIAGSLAVLWLIARSDAVDRVLRALIERVLRRYTTLEVGDYAALLHLRGSWRVSQLRVRDDDWMSERPLGELGLPEEGVTVLGVERRHGGWQGAPAGDLQLETGDLVVLYGRRHTLDALAVRLRGDERGENPGPAVGPEPEEGTRQASSSNAAL